MSFPLFVQDGDHRSHLIEVTDTGLALIRKCFQLGRRLKRKLVSVSAQILSRSCGLLFGN
jgi:hypothetical protein